MKNTTHDNVKDFVENFWLNLGDTKNLDLSGPICNGIFRPEDEEFPSVLMETMMNPEYLSFVCKEILNIDILPLQGLILCELWNKPFPMLIATRGCGKSFILALYAMLRAFLHQGCKIVLVGAAFRQSKIIFEYMSDIWYKSPILRDICGDSSQQGPRLDTDRYTMTVGSSKIIAIPLGNGEKIRGLRANYIICDEFASINKDIFENVVRGFAAVTASPVEAVKREAKLKAKKFLNIGDEPTAEEIYMGNQTIISGTAYFGFNHFHDYWERNKKIIESRGDQKRLNELFPDGVDVNLDYRDYSIMRIPYNLLPEGFMDKKQIAHARTNIHKAYFNMEYGAIFAKDTDGFFKRSCIEKCVANDENSISFQSSGRVVYTAMTRGNPKGKYIISVDPASENDKFSITVLELHGDHQRIVYAWTSTRKLHQEYIKAGLTKENDFYHFCARKIRELMRMFNCEAIGIDGQGGGIAVEEALKDTDKIGDGEVAILPVIDEKDPKPTDDMQGKHILHVFQFADNKWVTEANHGLRKDIEDRVLLFPEFDPITLGFSIEDDKLNNRKFDTLEDCMLEIEELKDELASIVHTTTESGKDKFTTPEQKIPGSNKKGRMRKDRYSSLLIGNYLARNMNREAPKKEYQLGVGGFADRMAGKDAGGPMFSSGPNWWTDGMKNVY